MVAIEYSSTIDWHISVDGNFTTDAERAKVLLGDDYKKVIDTLERHENLDVSFGIQWDGDGTSMADFTPRRNHKFARSYHMFSVEGQRKDIVDLAVKKLESLSVT